MTSPAASWAKAPPHTDPIGTLADGRQSPQPIVPGRTSRLSTP